MPHCILLGDSQQYFWNVDAHVGLNAPNRKGDVELVQFAYFCMATNGLAGNSSLRTQAGAVVPGAPYAGSPNDPLTKCILLHQQICGGIRDGRVSPITGNSGSYGNATWLLVPLNVHLAAGVGAAIWPRIADDLRCPSTLDQESNFALILPNSGGYEI